MSRGSVATLPSGAGLKNGHGMAVDAQQPQHSRARAFEIARVVHDDVEPATAHFAQKSREALGARRVIPTGLRQVLIEHLDVVPRERDQLVDGCGLLGNRRQLDDARLADDSAEVEESIAVPSMKQRLGAGARRGGSRRRLRRSSDDRSRGA